MNTNCGYYLTESPSLEKVFDLQNKDHYSNQASLDSNSAVTADSLNFCPRPDNNYSNHIQVGVNNQFLDLLNQYALKQGVPGKSDKRSIEELKPKQIRILTRKQEVKQFTENKQVDSDQKILPRQEAQTDWMVMVILLSFFSIAWVRFYYDNFLVVTLNSTTNSQVADKMFRERNTLTARVSFVLNTVFIINSALFICQILHHFKLQIFNFSELTGFFIILLAIVVAHLIKYLVYKIFGFLFMIDKLISIFIHNLFVYNKTLGLALIPVVTAIPFLEERFRSIAIYIGVICFILTYCAQIIRGLKIILYNNIYKYYLILYLCALEILPLLVVYKFVLSLLLL